MRFNVSEVHVWEEGVHRCASCTAQASLYFRRLAVVAAFCQPCALDVQKVEVSFPDSSVSKPSTIGREEYETVMGGGDQRLVPKEAKDLIKKEVERVISNLEEYLKEGVFDPRSVKVTLSKGDRPAAVCVRFPVSYSRSVLGSKRRAVVTAVSKKPDSDWDLDTAEVFGDFFKSRPSLVKVTFDGRVYTCNDSVPVHLAVKSAVKHHEDEFMAYLSSEREAIRERRSAADRKAVTAFIKSYSHMADEIAEMASELVVSQVHKL